MVNCQSRGSHKTNGALPSAEWRPRLEAWRELLSECARKPSRKRVLALRSLTLRLQAQISFALQEQPPTAGAVRAFRRWSKQGKKLRLALQPVRDADVFLARLASLRSPAGDTPVIPAHLSPQCLREVEALEFQLHRRRRAGAKELTEVIDALSHKLNRRSRQMETAIGAELSDTAVPSRRSAFQVFSELATKQSALDKNSLHAYRKQLKRALYLAEISAATDPESAQLSAEFRRIHDAVGEWHDFQTLAEEAACLLSKHGDAGDSPPAPEENTGNITKNGEDGLISLLEARTEEALKVALERCHQAAARLLPQGGETEQLPPRKPVASVHHGSISHSVTAS